MPSIEDLLRGCKKSSNQEEQNIPKELEEKLQDIDLKEREGLARNRANNLGYPYIDLRAGVIIPEALALIPKDQARKWGVVCFSVIENVAHLGVVEPERSGPEVSRIVKRIKKDRDLTGKVYVISEAGLEHAIKLYDVLPRTTMIRGSLEITESSLNSFRQKIKNLKDLGVQIKKVSLTDFINFVVAGALQVDASDIHIETSDQGIKLRYRLDGALYDVASLPNDEWPKIVTRIKLLSGLKLNITKKPQDGRFTIFLTNDQVDVRVSTLPTSSGESVVMRLLLSSRAGVEFEQLGLRGQAFEILTKEIQKPNGMILTTGPTGSGKTTTIYAILKKLNRPEVKIVTIEDPIEYKLEGINQSQVDKDKDYTFASGLRSIVRQDPNVIMVGEIRDLETAQIAIDAALTGHLVASTLHTNDAAGAIPRLISMGVRTFAIGPALNAVVGQRLARKICLKCKVEAKIETEKLARIKKILEDIPKDSGYRVDIGKLKFYQGQGCQACSNIGYKGRIGIYEVLTAGKKIEDLIITEKATNTQIQDLAISEGMLTMVQDGLLKALEGITSVSEIEREIGL